MAQAVSTREDRWIPGIDGLRACAIVPVIVTHAAVATRFRPGLAPEPLATLINTGGTGVDLFFAISGFLITTILLRGGTVGGFYLRRALRILPAFFLSLALWFVVFPVLPGVTVVKPIGNVWQCDPKVVVALATFTMNYAVAWGQVLTCAGIGALVTWSLCIEEHFYLFYPWLLRAFRTSSSRIAAASLVVLGAPLARWYAFTSFDSPAAAMGLRYLTHLRLDALALGCVAAAVWSRFPSEATRRPRRIALGILAAVVAVFLVRGEFSEERLTGWSFSFGLSAVSMLFSTVVLEVASERTWLTRTLDWRPLRQLGRVSYGMYLLHFPVLEATFQLLRRVPLPMGPTARFLVATTCFVLATFAVAWLMYSIWEKPFLRLRARFA